MIRAGNLINDIADISNLELAFWKAAKGKTVNPKIIDYRNNLTDNLKTLHNQILTGDVAVGNYYYFKVFDPKERTICAAEFSERVLHHAIINICLSVFERKQIANSYACRKTKGTYAAIAKAQLNCKKYKWYLKLDFRKYFDSIDHNVLFTMLCNTFKDKVLLEIYKKIIDSYNTEKVCGIPIGNLSSQYFANHFLSYADHYAIEKLQAPAYVRYMDDVIVWADTKQELLRFHKIYDSFCKTELKLTLKPLILNKVKYGLNFLGYKLYRQRTLLNRRSKNRYKQKMLHTLKLYESGIISEKEYQIFVQPLIAFTKHADSLEYRKKVLFLCGE